MSRYGSKCTIDKGRNLGRVQQYNEFNVYVVHVDKTSRKGP